jgi:energy-converting hydrogenase Eha subunit F
MHVALVWQLSVPVVHSLISEQLYPSPPYPLSQLQLKPPAVLVQEALVSQLSVPSVHSLSSEQWVPSPV